MKDRKEENHSQSLLNATPFTQLQMTSLLALQEGKKSTIVENITVKMEPRGFLCCCLFEI